MDRNFGAEGGIAWEQLKIWLERATQAYKIAFALVVIGAIALVILGVQFNQWGIAGANFILALMFLIIWAFFQFHPAGLLAVFGIGGLNGLPKDWSLNVFFREGRLPDLQLSEVGKQGFEFIKKLAHYTMHVALFMTVMFVVLGTFEIKTAKAVLPIFIVLAGIGLWTTLTKTNPKWYFRTTGWILVISLLMFVYKAFITGEDASAPIREAKGVWADWNYKKTFDLELASFKDTEVCGLKPGTRKFTIPSSDRDRTWVEVPGEAPVDLSSALRLNGTWPEESFEVTDKDGCVTVTFALNPAYKQKAITPRVIRFIVV